jgi:hypothetical protein
MLFSGRLSGRYSGRNVGTAKGQREGFRKGSFWGRDALTRRDASSERSVNTKTVRVLTAFI